MSNVLNCESYFIPGFFAWKTSILTLVGFKHVRWHVTTFPDVLKSLSEGELLAGIQRYFLASLLRCGKST